MWSKSLNLILESGRIGLLPWGCPGTVSMNGAPKTRNCRRAHRHPRTVTLDALRDCATASVIVYTCSRSLCATVITVQTHIVKDTSIILSLCDCVTLSVAMSLCNCVHIQSRSVCHCDRRESAYSHRHPPSFCDYVTVQIHTVALRACATVSVALPCVIVYTYNSHTMSVQCVSVVLSTRAATRMFRHTQSHCVTSPLSLAPALRAHAVTVHVRRVTPVQTCPIPCFSLTPEDYDLFEENRVAHRRDWLDELLD